MALKASCRVIRSLDCQLLSQLPSLPSFLSSSPPPYISQRNGPVERALHNWSCSWGNERGGGTGAALVYRFHTPLTPGQQQQQRRHTDFRHGLGQALAAAAQPINAKVVVKMQPQI